MIRLFDGSRSRIQPGGGFLQAGSDDEECKVTPWSCGCHCSSEKKQAGGNHQVFVIFEEVEVPSGMQDGEWLGARLENGSREGGRKPSDKFDTKLRIRIKIHVKRPVPT